MQEDMGALAFLALMRCNGRRSCQFASAKSFISTAVCDFRGGGLTGICDT
jgi:hypothetical protein